MVRISAASSLLWASHFLSWFSSAGELSLLWPEHKVDRPLLDISARRSTDRSWSGQGSDGNFALATDGYGVDCGRSRGCPCKVAIRPEAKLPG
jgi:hypothetical protein